MFLKAVNLDPSYTGQHTYLRWSFLCLDWAGSFLGGSLTVPRQNFTQSHCFQQYASFSLTFGPLWFSHPRMLPPQPRKTPFSLSSRAQSHIYLAKRQENFSEKTSSKDPQIQTFVCTPLKCPASHWLTRLANTQLRSGFSTSFLNLKDWPRIFIYLRESLTWKTKSKTNKQKWTLKKRIMQGAGKKCLSH